METTLTSRLIKTTTSTDGSSLLWIPSQLRGYSSVYCTNPMDCHSTSLATIENQAASTYTVPAFTQLAGGFDDHVIEYNTGHMNASETHNGIYIRRDSRVRVYGHLYYNASGIAPSASSLHLLLNGAYASEVVTAPTVLQSSHANVVAIGVESHIAVETYTNVTVGEVVRLGIQSNAGDNDFSIISYRLEVAHV